MEVLGFLNHALCLVQVCQSSFHDVPPSEVSDIGLRISDTNQIRVWQQMPIIPAFRRQGQESQVQGCLQVSQKRKNKRKVDAIVQVLLKSNRRLIVFSHTLLGRVLNIFPISFQVNIYLLQLMKRTFLFSFSFSFFPFSLKILLRSFSSKLKILYVLRKQGEALEFNRIFKTIKEYHLKDYSGNYLLPEGQIEKADPIYARHFFKL